MATGRTVKFTLIISDMGWWSGLHQVEPVPRPDLWPGSWHHRNRRPDQPMFRLLPRQDLTLPHHCSSGVPVEPTVALRRRRSAPQKDERDEDRQHPLRAKVPRMVPAAPFTAVTATKDDLDAGSPVAGHRRCRSRLRGPLFVETVDSDHGSTNAANARSRWRSLWRLNARPSMFDGA